MAPARFAAKLMQLALQPLPAWGHDASRDRGGVLYRDAALEQYVSANVNIVQVLSTLGRCAECWLQGAACCGRLLGAGCNVTCTWRCGSRVLCLCRWDARPLLVHPPAAPASAPTCCTAAPPIPRRRSLP